MSRVVGGAPGDYLLGCDCLKFVGAYSLKPVMRSPWRAPHLKPARYTVSLSVTWPKKDGAPGKESKDFLFATRIVRGAERLPGTGTGSGVLGALAAIVLGLSVFRWLRLR